MASASPCVNSGTTTALAPSVPEDVRGDERSSGTAPDMGAHEYSTTGVWSGDLDGDGISDQDELYTYGTLFYSSDTDADRMDDGYEVAHGLSLLQDDRYGDKDGDGFPNLAEFLKGTSASDNSSAPTADRVVGAGESYTTISAALASLTSDDQIIMVKAGVYPEAVGNTGAGAKRVFILSESADSNLTTIKPASGVVVSSTKDLCLRGFTLSGAGSYGVSLTGSGYYGIIRCILRGHSHGVYSASSSTSVRNFVDIVGTLMLDGTGSGVYASAGPAAFRLIHATISGQGSYAIFNSTSGSSSTYALNNCVMWNNGSSQFYLTNATLTAAYSCVKGASVYAGTGNINSDPQLLQGYLGGGSPCVNTGVSNTTPLVVKDVRGDARSIGTAPDMGAHEYSTTGVWSGDLDGDGVSDQDELYTYGTLFYSSDTDADRMNDGYEVVHGLSLLADDRYGDKDGDGVPNLLECLRGTSASDNSSVPSADRVVGAGESYTTISAALASLTIDDQFILVRPGTYAESVANTGAGAKRVFILSESADPNLTTIKPASGVVVSSTKDLCLRGFTLSGAGSYGVSLTGSGCHGLVQCILRGHSYGIYSSPSSTSVRNYVDVIGCLVLDGTNAGIRAVTGPATFRLIHTTICGQASHAISSSSSGSASIYTLVNCVMWNTCLLAVFPHQRNTVGQLQLHQGCVCLRRSREHQQRPAAGSGLSDQRFALHKHGNDGCAVALGAGGCARGRTKQRRRAGHGRT